MPIEDINPINWEDPATYQSLISQNGDAVAQQLTNPTSQKSLAAFATAISDHTWAVEHPDLCVTAFKLIPTKQSTLRGEIVTDIFKAGAANPDSQHLANALLALACQEGDISSIRTLIAAGADVNARNDEEATPLHLAAGKGAVDIVETLIAAGADIHVENHIGETPLHKAAFSGQLDAVAKLIAAGADIHAQDYFELTPLHKAVLGGQFDVLDTLIAAGANINAKNDDESTPLHLAVAKGTLEVSDALITAGALVTVWNDSGGTPLHLAAGKGALDIVEKLIAAGANINAKNDDESTPLHVAASNSQAGIVLKLLEAGADKEKKDISGWTALHIASEKGDLDTANILATSHANIEAKTADGKTPLHLASGKGHIQIVRTLLQLQANMDVQSHDGQTPLHDAIYANQITTAQYLIEAGASPAIMDNEARTPLRAAVSRGAFFDSKILDALVTADWERGQGVTEEIDHRKILAHHFGLGGTSQIRYKEFNLEGGDAAVAVSHLWLQVNSFYSQITTSLDTPGTGVWNDIVSRLTPKTQEAIHQHLSNDQLKKILGETQEAILLSYPERSDALVERHQEGLPIAMVTGWPGHTTALVTMGDKICLCNRGDSCGDTPGVLSFAVGNPDNLHAALDRCLPEKTHTTTKGYLTSEIHTELDLKQAHHLRQQPQKVGNCSVANTNSMELALLYLQLEPILGSKAAEELARAIKKGRTQDSRTSLLTEYLDYHRKPRPIAPDLSLLGQLYHKRTGTPGTDLQVKRLIRNWAEDMNVNVESIIGWDL